NRSNSMASAESTDTVEATGSQEIQEPPMSDIKSRMRSYVDTAIQAASASLMQNMQQFMNQQAEAQREWSSHLLETVNQRLSNSGQTAQSISTQDTTSRQFTNQLNSQQQATETRRESRTASGNYPPTPIVNNLILQSSLGIQSAEIINYSEMPTYKMTNRKYPSLNYTFKENASAVQGFINQKAI
ncbi:13712_t:CDS:1, partial [Cetraspora pellucida]